MSGIKSTLIISIENRKTLDRIKFAYNIRSVQDAINKAISFMMEHDPKLKKLKEEE